VSGPAWQLPAHAVAEARLLERHGITSWQSLAALDDSQLRRLAGQGGSSEPTLRRLRGQARLVAAVGLEPAQAALLLHAGIADARGLARADPQQLWVQTGRLQRRLTGQAVAPPDLATLQDWINRARRDAN
jgi:predicted RecB family nuclease